MNYILIIYLIGVLINICISVSLLKNEYNNGIVITVANILGHIIICLTSWIFLISALAAWLYLNISVILCKPLFKRNSKIWKQKN